METQTNVTRHPYNSQRKNTAIVYERLVWSVVTMKEQIQSDPYEIDGTTIYSSPMIL